MEGNKGISLSLTNHTKAKYFANRTILLQRPKPSHSLSYSGLTFITKKFQKNCQRKLVKKKIGDFLKKSNGYKIFCQGRKKQEKNQAQTTKGSKKS